MYSYIELIGYSQTCVNKVYHSIGNCYYYYTYVYAFLYLASIQ